MIVIPGVATQGGNPCRRIAENSQTLASRNPNRSRGTIWENQDRVLAAEPSFKFSQPAFDWVIFFHGPAVPKPEVVPQCFRARNFQEQVAALQWRPPTGSPRGLWGFP